MENPNILWGDELWDRHKFFPERNRERKRETDWTKASNSLEGGGGKPKVLIYGTEEKREIATPHSPSNGISPICKGSTDRTLYRCSGGEKPLIEGQGILMHERNFNNGNSES